MNDSEEYLKSTGFKRLHVLITKEHLDFLKTIDENNTSSAIRALIDRYMNMTKRQVLERYLLYIVFILCIFTAITLFINMI